MNAEHIDKPCHFVLFLWVSKIQRGQDLWVKCIRFSDTSDLPLHVQRGRLNYRDVKQKMTL